MGGMFPGSGIMQFAQGSGPYKTIYTGSTFANPFGQIWFIDPVNGADANSGTTADKAFKTLGQALLVSKAGDTFVLGPGTYVLTSALVPLANQLFVAAIIKPASPTVIIQSNFAVAGALVDINVNQVAFIGIEFQANDNNLTSLARLGNAATTQGILFEYCIFNGQSKTGPVQGITVSSNFASTRMGVHGCTFTGLTDHGITVGTLGCALGEIWENQMNIDTAGKNAINLGDTGSFTVGKGLAIYENWFVGQSSAAAAVPIGITAAGGDGTTGAAMITQNHCAWCATSFMTATKLTKSNMQNYIGSAGGLAAGTS